MLNLYILFLLGSHVSATNQPPSLSGLQPSTPFEKEEESLEACDRKVDGETVMKADPISPRKINPEKEEESLEACDRKVDGETVMKADPIPPRKINPGSTTFSDLAPPPVVVVPKSTRVHGVQWITGEDGGPGTIIFPDNFSGIIETEIATHLYLKYYGAKMATENYEPIDVHIPHDQTTFKYFDDYHEKYVDGVVGASLERHNFCHTDRPEGHHSGSGHFVIGKFVDTLETVMDLTGFQVPQGQTIFIPAGVIHTNNYLLGRWNTMLATKENIDEVKMVKKGSAFSFTFGDQPVSKKESVDTSSSSVNNREAPDYPQSFTLQVNAARVGGNPWSQFLGLYRRMNLIQNGRPVWKLETAAHYDLAHVFHNQYLFYSGDNYWMFGRDYTRDMGLISSGSSGLLSIPSTGWKYARLGVWKEDLSLTVTIE